MLKALGVGFYALNVCAYVQYAILFVFTSVCGLYLFLPLKMNSCLGPMLRTKIQGQRVLSYPANFHG